MKRFCPTLATRLTTLNKKKNQITNSTSGLRQRVPVLELHDRPNPAQHRRRKPELGSARIRRSFPSRRLRSFAAVPVQHGRRHVRHLRCQRIPQMCTGAGQSVGGAAVRHFARPLQSVVGEARESAGGLRRRNAGKSIFKSVVGHF